jgi:ferritin
MISDKIREALNDQINKEFNASYTYLGMSTWCERHAFKGSALWLGLQSREEQAHGMKIHHFLLARDCDIELDHIAKPPVRYETLLDVFESAYEHEQRVSQSIDAMYELAFDEKAFAALVELQWFLTEQVSEEQACREIVKQLRMVKDDPSAVLDLDRELSTRATAD